MHKTYIKLFVAAMTRHEVEDGGVIIRKHLDSFFSFY